MTSPEPPGSGPAAPGSDAPPPVASRGPLALHWKILAGLAVGACAGLVANAVVAGDAEATASLRAVIDGAVRPAGQIFLRLVFMVVLPLVFSAIVLGITGLGDTRALGRLGARTLKFTVIFSTVSVLVGLAFANVVRPGDRLSDDKRAELRAHGGREGGSLKQVEQARKAKPLGQLLRDLVPENPLQEAVGALDGSAPGGGMLAVMCFALLFGLAAAAAREQTAALVAALEGLYAVAMQIIDWAMRLAPYGVAALVFSLTAVLGLDILRTLVWYVAAVVSGLLLHAVVVYGVALRWVARRSPLDFARGASSALLTAFGTSSSNATLPVSLRVAHERLGLRDEVSRFVLTVGATANQNGTALYEGLTVLFLAQVYGVELSLAQQASVMLMAVLAGIGTAGVPGGSLPLVGAVLLTVGVPAEGLAIILGVDRVLDMCRTTVNVAGDLVIAACVDAGERRAIF